MTMRRWVKAGLAGTLLGASAVLAAQDPAMLARVARGEWQLHQVGSRDDVVSHLCVTRPAQLIQLRENDSSCTRSVLSEAARSATVSYSCPTGTGRTTLTMSGSGSVHIATQGLSNGEPFDTEYDAHLIGHCS